MTAKKKPMTTAQKKFNAQMKKEMQEKGIIPPDKPKLNRKKFIEEAKQAWSDRDKDCLTWDVYLMNAISFMIGHTDKRFKASQEAVGVAKVLKLAIREKEFHEKLKAEGKHTYKMMEEYEFVKDILDA